MKTGGFGEPYDELTPFAVGRDGARNRQHAEAAAISPFACWPPAEYGTTVGKVREVVCGHIHSSALADDGRLWAWGCGSNDGRCGVERFLNRAGENRPPEVDTLKCYMMGPHRVGCARPRYWPHGPSLDGVRVIAVATGRNHMAAIGVGGGPPAAYCHSTYRARDVDEKVVAPVGDAARARGATVVHEYDGPSDGVYESIWTRSNDYPPCAAPPFPTPTPAPAIQRPPPPPSSQVRLALRLPFARRLAPIVARRLLLEAVAPPLLSLGLARRELCRRHRGRLRRVGGDALVGGGRRHRRGGVTGPNHRPS